MKTILLVMCLSLSSMICLAQNKAETKAKAAEANDEQLLACIKKGDEDCVAWALAAGADANATNEEDVSALSLAAEGKRESIVRLLLNAGADVNAAGKGEATPLCLAARFGREKIVELLLDKGAKVNAVCDADHGDTSLMESLQRALLSGMPGDWKDEIATSDDDGDDKNEDKNKAAEASNGADKLREELNAPSDSFLAIARKLLARGADVNVVAHCDMGETALMYAVMSADLEMVKELLSHGADVNKGVPVLALLRHFEIEYEKTKRLALPAFSKGQRSVLEWNEKTKAAQEEIKKLLRAAGAKETVDDDEEESVESDTEALEEAAREAFSSTVKKDDVEDLERLIKAYMGTPLGAQVMPEALRIAVIYDRTESLKLLLARGVDPNGGRYKPLIQATCDGKLEYVLMLLEAGADVNGTDDDGRSALDFAESWGDSREEKLAIIEALKARGAKSAKQK
ncbi:MAG TPA: ankyrin repeat domain-containing protein [Pyrinomonadaceae bacterium]